MRLVLDTNVVLDLFHWGEPAAVPILTAARAGRVVLVANDVCIAELKRVIDRPEFGLDAATARAIVQDYRALVIPPGNLAAAPEAAPLPRCRDPDDQKFLELARDACADILVTRDKALLTLARRKYGLSAFRILKPGDAVAALAP